MTGQRLRDYLVQIRQAAFDACSFVDGLDGADFLADKRTQQAVILNLLIIGEAVARVMDRHGEFAESHPEVPWRNIRSMRNRIAHGYFDIDIDIVWETVQSALPPLLAQVDGFLVATGDPPPAENPSDDI